MKDASSARHFPESVAMLYAIFPVGILIISVLELNSGRYVEALQDLGVAVLLTVPLAAGLIRRHHHHGDFPAA